jgi:crossover junction endodeoxyribonuclease RuvC
VRIIGFDPGSIKTGFGVIDVLGPQKLIHVSHGTIFLGNKNNLEIRLKELADASLLILKKYQPKYAAIEDVFFSKSARSALVLGQARGVLIASLAMQNLLAQSISPTSVKSLVAGHGRAQKFQIKKMVALHLNISEPEQEDAADALGVAVALGFKLLTK